MFGNAREAANVGEQDSDRLNHAAKLERFGILEHLGNDVLRQESTVVKTRDFFFRQALVRAHVLDGNCSLRGDGAD